ncbi:MAG: AAA family ATPase [Bacteroidales bacterium]|nr:AAA family ATPase [Bacteroidales bacterium]
MKKAYSSTPQCVLVTGARQIGKTHSIRKFGREAFKHFVEVNFVETPGAIQIFHNAQSVEEIISRLSAFTSQPLVENETLVFFDEVQKCPECVTQMKFLVEDGRFRYAMSGSLLGVELKGLRSAPVGYIDVKEMYPLDFEEFILALGVNQRIVDTLKACFDQRKAVDPVIHDRLMSLFYLYLVVGGMPAAVSRYVKTNNIQEVVAAQQAIINLYRLDISQYDPQSKLYLDEIFDLIPSELDAKNKRFILKNLNENFKFSRYKDSFLWMKNAGIALPTYNVEEPRVPLRLNEQRNLFKLFSSDVGLLCCQYANGIQLKMLSGEIDINFGAIFENVVAQELTAHGFSLYYFNSKKLGELDFVVEHGGVVLPIEVKSGKDYAKHKALSNVMNTPEYGIPEAVVLCNDNVHTAGAVVYLPVYMVMFLVAREEVPAMVFKPDLSGLE